MNQPIPLNFPKNIKLTIKREDLLHPHISGNKFRKLKYNILEAQKQHATQLLTFGGAYSNHIAATAAAGKEYGIKTIGVIRGEEIEDKINDNPTLCFSRECGMQFHFISREDYRDKTNPEYIKSLKQMFGDFYLVPEGGTNQLAIKGCEEILTATDNNFTHIACAVGTGGTISGIINTALPHQKVIGFPALKNAGLSVDIIKFAQQDNWQLIEDYHFGGYGKVNTELVGFINDFFQKTDISLDPVYTGKMVFGVIDLINNNFFPDNAEVLLIHTGGLQGISGMNRELTRKKLPLIKTRDK
ncbi:1-aminocyclopropane-1-carboxylate deaminase/D-cysteine desulfhydrase [Flavobacterium arcticum]|uniref:1-aminocyclopropane-1-carboxylate deaminase/D-cysteine desulfhydrase n=1 Tax=Flavobacterium arcticum TaxID=1784713 RepID=A0A345H8G0_9FLAO|nr:pyridoxal-phosphate dependent enzyme [Flavobacterium arcticum]AXG72870.1 1-aminocyclopropane-1-carboxylate deaminase/D-cysteine desulfhydrase [Flavobacterium arcticum]KAF2510466.1 1-aminocyclopropane-1-carboxylate deaminase/D-cysteine desulfhydrase [Flavobacterium arcticum]